MPTIEQLKSRQAKADAAIKAARLAKQKAAKAMKELTNAARRKRALEIGMMAQEHGLFEWTNEELYAAFKSLSRPNNTGEPSVSAGE